MSDTNTNTNTKNNKDWSDREIGALWKYDGKNQKYLSGYIKTSSGEELKVVVFSNKFRKENEKSPHFRIYKSKDKAQDEFLGGKDTASESKSEKKPTATNAAPLVEEDELI